MRCENCVENKICKLYRTAYQGMTVVEIHTNDTYYNDQDVIGCQFIPVAGIILRGHGWTSGEFKPAGGGFKYPGIYFYNVRFYPCYEKYKKRHRREK